jgi:aspartyl/asparaginyl beta-hydroxylase (cupin superfamily)
VPSAAVFDPRRFPFVPTLQAACASIRAEMLALPPACFPDAPDALSVATADYDERGWTYCPLVGDAPAAAANLARCSATARALAAMPGLVNAGFSRFAPGTRLDRHAGELRGVLRCHLPLAVPTGDLGLEVDGVVLRWREGECLVFDDTVAHTAWNLGDGDRTVLLVTFARP